MRKVYTGIDIGTDSIKIVISEFFNDKFHVLASTSVKSQGLKRGIVVDKELAITSLKNAIKDIESTIGIKIKEAVVTVPSNDRVISIVEGHKEVTSSFVTGDDIIDCINDSVTEKVESGYQRVSLIPIYFTLDDEQNIKNPRGRKGSNLSVKAILVTVPYNNVKPIFEVFQKCDIEIKDITFATIGDYYEARGKDTDSTVGAIINIGSSTINISIFNKGIIIKNDIINLGSKNVDKDISYMYGVDLSTSKLLKENYSVCSRRYADINDNLDVNISEEEKITINQYELSEIVEARVSELLKLAKKQINHLTNRKISYIIVTGGISELTGFGYVVENVLGINASTLNMTTLGIRNNKYSSASGIIKYFYEKSILTGVDYSMFDDTMLNEMMNNKKNLLNTTSDNIVSKVFNFFTNN